MNADQPLTDSDYQLQKFPGKGGWTYVHLPNIPPDKHTHFGWVRVRGSIDGYAINGYNLQPLGNGQLCLPVKAAIRKHIRKQAGDTVRLVLFADNAPTTIPNELTECLTDVPTAQEAFMALPDGARKAVIDWIYSAKADETKAERIIKTIHSLLARKP